MGIKSDYSVKKPKTPSFNSIPAKITEPTVGASTCASGNQIWKGNIGTLDAKDKKNASQSQYCSLKLNEQLSRYSRFNVPTVE